MTIYSQYFPHKFFKITNIINHYSSHLPSVLMSVKVFTFFHPGVNDFEPDNLQFFVI